MVVVVVLFPELLPDDGVEAAAVCEDDDDLACADSLFDGSLVDASPVPFSSLFFWDSAGSLESGGLDFEE